jgi:hypothetical protein
VFELNESFVRKQIIKYLYSKKWNRRSAPKELHDKGVDIQVWKNHSNRSYLVEVAGESKGKNPKQAAQKNFLRVLAEIITRWYPERDYRYGVGFPASTVEIALRRIPWGAAKMIKLTVFSVTEDGKVYTFDWKELRKMQTPMRFENEADYQEIIGRKR